MVEYTKLVDEPIYKSFVDKIDEFVTQKLVNYETSGLCAKTIHDPIWGSVFYFSWEVQIIDSPIFQRLRNVGQVGLAGLTYPSARHSRFEHSLGTTAIASQMLESIMKRSSEDSIKIENIVLYKVRLAALLHDIGHCFYSHLSESVYGKMEEFKLLQDLFKKYKKALKPKPHEIFSYLIINTPSFKTFIREKVDFPSIRGLNINDFMIEIGNMIIGYNNESASGNIIYSYMTSIINGSFDADKLDYIKRDSYLAGLALTYDIERLLYKIDVKPITIGEKTDQRLTIDINGVTALEELTFSKIMLFSYIYHHQKVLISEEIVKDLIYGLLKLKVFVHPCDFLKYTDNDIETLASKNNEHSPFPRQSDSCRLSYFSEKIKFRRLPKRCFELNQKNITSTETIAENNEESITRIIEDCVNNSISNQNKKLEFIRNAVRKTIISSSLSQKPVHNIVDQIVFEYESMTYEEILDKRKEFFDKLCDEYEKQSKKVNFSIFDIYIVIPKKVNYSVTDEKCVATRISNEVMKVDDFIKLKDWADAFNANKWKGYVFVSSHIDIDLAYKVSKDTLIGDSGEVIEPAAYIKNLTYHK